MSDNTQHREWNVLRDLIRALLVESGLPSLTVAVAREGEMLWEEGFGWANREERILATPHTLYSLASISKPITATGLMVLVERGLIDLDRPVNDYLGDAKVTARTGNADEATVRRVASHSSGLPLHYHFFYEDEPYVPPPREETIRRYGKLVLPPGEEYWYSNLGYGILDHIISRVAGVRYADFMRQEVFIPLNMPHASVHIGPGLERHRAARYAPNGSPLPFYDFDHPGASAVFCSAHDLVRFGMFHLKAHLGDQKAILADATLDEMHTIVIESDKTSGYGIGWRINPDDNGYRVIEHGGGMGGVSTILKLLPAENLTVAVLTNGNTRIHLRVADEILSALLPAYAKAYAESRARRKAQDRGAQDTGPVGFQPVPELLGTWSGSVHTCQGEIPLILEFQPDGDIHAQLGDQLKTLVNEARFEDGTFRGLMAGDLRTEDTRDHTRLQFYLKRRGTTLQGALTATRPPGVGERMRNALSHWVELNRTLPKAGNLRTCFVKPLASR